jgi:hypothetical protein
MSSEHVGRVRVFARLGRRRRPVRTTLRASGSSAGPVQAPSRRCRYSIPGSVQPAGIRTDPRCGADSVFSFAGLVEARPDLWKGRPRRRRRPSDTGTTPDVRGVFGLEEPLGVRGLGRLGAPAGRDRDRLEAWQSDARPSPPICYSRKPGPSGGRAGTVLGRLMDATVRPFTAMCRALARRTVSRSTYGRWCGPCKTMARYSQGMIGDGTDWIAGIKVRRRRNQALAFAYALRHIRPSRLSGTVGGRELTGANRSSAGDGGAFLTACSGPAPGETTSRRVLRDGLRGRGRRAEARDNERVHRPLLACRAAAGRVVARQDPPFHWSSSSGGGVISAGPPL